MMFGHGARFQRALFVSYFNVEFLVAGTSLILASLLSVSLSFQRE